MPSSTRTEHDALGTYPVPVGALYGIYTARVRDLYHVSGIPVPLFIIRMYIRVKKAYAQANLAHGKLPTTHAQAIQTACRKLLKMPESELRQLFAIDIIQSGGGTSTNMPVNEVIANLANQTLGRQLGEYVPVHPNDHVNQSQSSNDSMPGVSKLTSYFQLALLLAELDACIVVCQQKAKEWQGELMVGRTHLQEAVPIPANGLWEGYAATLQGLYDLIKERQRQCLQVPFGASAAGTEHQIDAALRQNVLHVLSDEFGLTLRAPTSYFQATSSSADWSQLAGTIVTVGEEMVRISNDLRLLSAGPRTGWHEVKLPAVQPGSSTMPGKINPSVLEATTMACWRAMALARSVTEAASNAQLQLQAFWPMVAFHTYESLELLINVLPLWREHALAGVRPQPKQMHENLANSLARLQGQVATFGYDTVAKQVAEALHADEE